MAIFFACFCRKRDSDTQAAEHLDDDASFELGNDEEHLEPVKVCIIDYFL